MATKEWAHVEMLINGANVFDLMKFCEGKILAGSLKVRPVKHGGTDEEGAPTPRPTGRDILMALATSQKQFAIKEATALGAERGVTKGSVYGATNILVKEKTLKRVGPGIYALASNKKAKERGKQQTRERFKESKKHRPVTPGTMMDKVLAAVRAQQNGTGEGVGIAALRKQLGGKNIAPYLSDLVEQKLITRVAPGTYRAA